jgi:pimeloyl-ACP methyl ester carboxylesterase
MAPFGAIFVCYAGCMPIMNQLLMISYQKLELEVSVRVNLRSDEWVVALHGIQSNKDLYDDLFDQEFLKDYSKIAMSFVGFGESSKPKDFSYDVQAQADVVRMVLDQLKIDHLHLIGHSLGGMVGTVLLEQLGNPILSFSNLEGNLVLADCGASKYVIQFPQDEFEHVGYQRLSEQVRQSGEPSALARSRWLKTIPAFVFLQHIRIDCEVVRE